MNGKGQVTPFTVVFLVLAIIVIWTFVLDPIFDISSDLAVTGGELTGVEQFLYSGFAIMILVGLILFVIAVGGALGGGG